MPLQHERERTDEAVRRLCALIDRERQTIERRWLDRICADLGNSGAELTDLRDGMPDYLASLVALLGQARGGQGQATDVSERAPAAWREVARKHGVTRVRIGFDIGQLVHEFVVLRHVIRELAHASGVGTKGVEALLADLLDAAIYEAVKAYVAARDYDARRQEAQNVAFLTHELRNALSNATLSAAELRRHARPELERTLDTLDRGHAHLREMIDGALLTEKFEADKVESQPVELVLGDLLEPALEAARQNAKLKRVDLRVHYDPALRVKVDPALTRSAVQNVVDNAVKYTDDGHVDVTVESQPDSFVFHVRDTCPGLSPEELRIIFEPFRRGRTRKQGMGLGLAIARRAVEVQGGSIVAESPEPRGCHFSIRLPNR